MQSKAARNNGGNGKTQWPAQQRQSYDRERRNQQTTARSALSERPASPYDQDDLLHDNYGSRTEASPALTS